MIKKALIFLFLGIVFSAKSQYVGVYQVNEGNCDFFIKDGNWPEAVQCFSQLFEGDSSNLDIKYKMAKGYTFSNIDKKRALALLEELKADAYSADDFQHVMAMAYFYNYKFSLAKKLFIELASSVGDGSEFHTKMSKQCDRSIAMMQSPVPVSFENLGSAVNSPAPDYLPIVTPDESTIFFATKREGVVGNLGSSEGFKTADIFSSKHKRNKYSRVRSIGSPNTLGNEFTAGQSENGEYLIYTVNNEEYFFDLFISEMGRRSYMAPELLEKSELKATSEQGASLSNDGNRLYFSSDLEGGIGGFDIYVIQKLPNGDWGEVQNLGPTINTAGNENYPLLTDNGQTLYFSSDTHLGMGGMDLFKSSFNSATNEWGRPVNLGYPVNTPFDDLNISFSKNQRYAYMAKNLDDSFGDLDIYRLTFEEKKEDYSLVQGQVLTADSTIIDQEINVEAYHENSGIFVGTYIVNRKNGKYSAILAPGEYVLEVKDTEGYKDYSKVINVLGKNDREDLIKFNIILESQ